MKLRALRRDRAARLGPELFLLDRVFDDCLERLALIPRRFRRALLLGCPDASWPDRLRQVAGQVDVRDPGRLFAEATGGSLIVEDAWNSPAGAYDLVLAIGTLDTVNDLPRALRSLCHAMQPGALLIGAISGGDTLPRLRSAMRAADLVVGVASAHAHPRIEPAALAPLLNAAGFLAPVIDIDRIEVAYRLLDRLVADLRAMGATNILRERSVRGLSRGARTAAADGFAACGDGDRTTERFEILHFAAWTPSAAEARRNG
jgi:NADH dehydrogenase [ubiquinone] 1 alpha subcomplex assembly factor 5